MVTDHSHILEQPPFFIHAVKKAAAGGGAVLPRREATKESAAAFPGTMVYSPHMFRIGDLSAVLILLFSGVLCFAQAPAHPLSFSSEDGRVRDFIQLPQNVLAILLNDKDDFPDGPPSNLHCEDHERAGDATGPEILCRTLPLSSRAGQNYLVIGAGDLRGAHIVPFWLFHRDDRGASLLFKTRSDQIEIIPRRFNGYAEIRATWIEGAGATMVTDSFRFNGRTYVRFRRQTQHQ